MRELSCTVRFRPCWIHTFQVLLLPAVFNLTFVLCFVNSAQHAPTLQFCTTCTHSTTYILPKFNCFSPLTVKLSPGQVSFLERNFSYLSDRNRQTDDTFLLVCVTHILFQWLNPELPVTIREGKHVCWILVNINHDGVLRCDAVQSGRRFLLLSIYWQQFPTKRRCPKIYVDIITH